MARSPRIVNSQVTHGLKCWMTSVGSELTRDLESFLKHFSTKHWKYLHLLQYPCYQGVTDKYTGQNEV